MRILEARARLNKSIGNLFPQQQALSGAGELFPVERRPGHERSRALTAITSPTRCCLPRPGRLISGASTAGASNPTGPPISAAIASYDDALVTLIGDVASSYVNIRTLEERLRVARRNLELQQESLRIATVQFKAGETSERDVQQATTQTAQTEAAIPRLEESLVQYKNGLAVLLGVTPDEIDRHLAGPSHIPTAPATVAAGIPRDLLRRRPDVRAAGLAAASKSALIGVAKATMYPSFSLAGEFGLTGNNEGEQFAGGHVQLGEPRAQGRCRLRLPDLQLRAADQPGARAGRPVSRGGAPLPEHGVECAAGGGRWPGGLCQRAAGRDDAGAGGDLRPPLHRHWR